MQKHKKREHKKKWIKNNSLFVSNGDGFDFKHLMASSTNGNYCVYKQKAR